MYLAIRCCEEWGSNYCEITASICACCAVVKLDGSLTQTQCAVSEPEELVSAAKKACTARAGAVHSLRDESHVLIERLITLSGSLNGRSMSSSILVDSGATSNFISQECVNRIRLCVEPLIDMLSVRMANGQPVNVC